MAIELKLLGLVFVDSSRYLAPEKTLEESVEKGNHSQFPGDVDRLFISFYCQDYLFHTIL